jgi:hypothetical protein
MTEEGRLSHHCIDSNDANGRYNISRFAHSAIVLDCFVISFIAVIKRLIFIAATQMSNLYTFSLQCGFIIKDMHEVSPK